MNFLLDTDICSAFMKGNGKIQNRCIQHGGQLAISVATLGELYTWVSRAKAPAERAQGLKDLLSDVVVLDANFDIAQKFGESEAAMLDRGLAIREFDLLIAATALVHDLTLVTHNVQDFVNVPGLKIDDWLKP